MGVDCRILLPGNVRIRDVASAIGVAVGFKPHKQMLSGNGYSTKVEGVTIPPTDLGQPDFLYIKFDDRHAYWSYEPTDTNPGGRLIMPKSTAFWCLVGQRLVDLFGGEVDYNDCDGIDVDYRVRRKSNKLNCPSSDDAWHSLQDRIAAVKPITLGELRAFTGAAYSFEQDEYEYLFDAAGNMVRGDNAVLMAA